MQATAAVVIDKASTTVAQILYLVVGMLWVARYVPLPASRSGQAHNSMSSGLVATAATSGTP
jgi:hypothetical protein